MNSIATTNKLFFKTVSSLYGLAGADETPASRNTQPRVALSAISSILSSERDLRRIGWQLAKLARHARLTGRMDLVGGISEAITVLPLPDEIKTAGLYYQAVVEKHSGNVKQARVVLAQVASGPANAFRCRAILELGKTFFDTGHPIAAMPLYLEAVRASRAKDFLTSTQAQMMIAVVRSIDGDHRGALRDLDRLWPMVRLASHEHPALRYDYLNSLAIELAETGRIDEAKHVIESALQSPFAHKYPNWRTTRDEIADKERRASYRPRIFSLAGLPPMSAATVPQTMLSELPQAHTSVDARVDPACGMESSSANTAARAIQSQTDMPHSVGGAAPAAAPIDPPGRSAAPRRSASTLSSCFIHGEMAPAARSKPIPILQTALAPTSGYPHGNPHFSGERGRTWARSRPISRVSAPHCQARRDPPDNVCAVVGYPRSPLARGPPDTSIKL
jgi:hypothetical protein